jgi:hypothetical protein
MFIIVMSVSVCAGEVDRASEALYRMAFFSYRRGFAPLGTRHSDMGWGCLVRCMQMLACEVLLRRHAALCTQQPRQVPPLASAGSASSSSLSSAPSGAASRSAVAGEQADAQLLRLFSDSEAASAPLSLHHFVECGERLFGFRAGQWFGPDSGAHCLA